jgi:hypothetical protein
MVAFSLLAGNVSRLLLSAVISMDSITAKLFRFVRKSMLITLSVKNVFLVVMRLSISVLGVMSYLRLKSLSLYLGARNSECCVRLICLYIAILSLSSTDSRL